MKKSVLLIFLLGSFTLTHSVQGQTPTPLPGCCTPVPNWTIPTLGTGSGVAVDRILKRVYATDNTNGVIKAFNYDGSPVSSFGGGTGQVTLAGAFGVAVGPCDYPGVYGVTRSYSPSAVTKFDTSGNLVWTSPALPDGGAFSICLDDQGNSYVSDENNPIYVFDKDGNQKPVTITGSGSWALNVPIGLFMQGLQLYVSDSGNDRFVQFTETGVNTYSYTLVQAVTVASHQPYCMTKGLDGDFYVSFQNDQGYQVYDGQFNPIAPFCANPVVYHAFGIALDETGAIYVASIQNNNVVKMQPCFNQPTFNNCYKGSNPPTPGAPFLYPSPAKGNSATISYNMSGPGNVDIKFWNTNGELVSEVTDRKISGVQLTPVNISRFTPGVYYFTLALKYDSGTSETSKPKAFAVVR